MQNFERHLALTSVDDSVAVFDNDPLLRPRTPKEAFKLLVFIGSDHSRTANPVSRDELPLLPPDADFLALCAFCCPALHERLRLEEYSPSLHQFCAHSAIAMGMLARGERPGAASTIEGARVSIHLLAYALRVGWLAAADELYAVLRAAVT